MARLAGAVRTMGAKFVVSMVGILLSILHGFLRARCTRELHAEADEAARRLRGRVVPVRDFQVECIEKQLQHTIAIRDSIESLKSIDVSVKDIGAELAAQLQHTVKNDIVAGIGNHLKDIVDGLERSLTESFATSLNAQVSLIAEELRKIEAAVAGQAHSQVEDLLTKLGDLVSGGFASESARMKDVLARFADVIPSLEAQMRTMSQSASADLAQRTADASRANAQLFDRLGVVLEGMERQQRDVNDASAAMQQFVMLAQSTLAGSLASANEQFSARSQNAMDQLTAAMRSATGNAAEVYSSLVKEVESAAKTLQLARSDAATGATQLREATQLMREPIQRMAELLSGLRDTVTTLASSVNQAKAAVDSGSAVVKSSAESVAQHQRFVEELTGRWPQMARQYLEDSDRQFKTIASAWRAQAEEIGESVSRISNTFATSASDFTSAVEDLGEHVGKLNGGSTARSR